MLASRSCTRLARSSLPPLASTVGGVACSSTRTQAVSPCQRQASQVSSSSSLPPAWNQPPTYAPLAPYPSQDKVQIIVDSGFFTVDTLNPTIITKSLREFGHQYGRSVNIKMFRQPHHPHALDLVNAGIEIRLYGSLVASKDDLPNQILISDLWTFAMDNPGSTTVLFTRDRTYAIPLNTLSNRGHKIVVVSDLNLAETEIAAAGVFVNVDDFTARWPVSAVARPPPSKVVKPAKTAEVASASKPAPFSPVKVVVKKSTASKPPSPPSAPIPPSEPGVMQASDEAVATFNKLAESLQALAELSSDMHAPSRPSKIPTRLVALLLQRMHREVVRHSGYPSASVMAHNLCEIYPEKLALNPKPNMPRKVRQLPQIITRVLEAFGTLPEMDDRVIGILRAFFFSDCPEFSEIELNKAAGLLVSGGKITQNSAGAYTISAGPTAKKPVPAPSASSTPSPVTPSQPTTAPSLIPPFPFPSSYSSSNKGKTPATSSSSPSVPVTPANTLSSFFAAVPPSKPGSKPPTPASTSMSTPSPSSKPPNPSSKPTGPASDHPVPSPRTTSAQSTLDLQYLALQLRGLQGYLNFLDTEKSSSSSPTAASKSIITPATRYLSADGGKASQTLKDRAPASPLLASLPSVSEAASKAASAVASAPAQLATLFASSSEASAGPEATKATTPSDETLAVEVEEASATSAPEIADVDAGQASEKAELRVSEDLPTLTRKLTPAESSVKKKKGKLVWN